jgi:hypothetical protein
VSRREEEVVFFVEAVLLVDFEEGFNAFLAAGSALVFALVALAFALVVVFAGLATTLGSLTSLFTVVFFVVVSLASLVVDLLVVGGFAALVAVVVDLDLEVDFAGTFLVVVLDTFAGLFWPIH